jgi:hypothetical protein
MFVSNTAAHNVGLTNGLTARRYVVGLPLFGETVYRASFGYYTVPGLWRWFLLDLREFFSSIRIELCPEEQE